MDPGSRFGNQPRRPTAASSTRGRNFGTAALFHRVREHRDQVAREQLVRQFMPLARWVARRYETADSAEDIRQVAYLGLVKAIDRFDPDRGASFASFGIPTIAGEVRRYLRDYGWDVHVPRGLQERAAQVRRARDRLTGELGRAPTVAELATELGSTSDSVLQAITAAEAYDAFSLESPCEATTHRAPKRKEAREVPGALDDGFERVLERDFIRVALATLPDRKRQMIGLRFLGGLTQSQIAARYGVSAMQVCRLLRQALAEMSETFCDGSGTLAEAPAGGSSSTSNVSAPRIARSFRVSQTRLAS